MKALRHLLLFTLLLTGLTAAYGQVQTRYYMVGNFAAVSDAGGGAYSVTFNTRADQSGQGYLANQIQVGYRILTASNLLYRVDAIASAAISSAELTVSSVGGTTGSPSGTAVVYAYDGSVQTIPAPPANSLGVSQAMLSAILTHNAGIVAAGGSIPTASQVPTDDGSNVQVGLDERTTLAFTEATYAKIGDAGGGTGNPVTAIEVVGGGTATTKKDRITLADGTVIESAPWTDLTTTPGGSTGDPAAVFEFNVDDYGAIANDGGDDSPAFQAAWDAMKAADGHVIGLGTSGGVYNLTAVNFIGGGADSAFVVLDLNGGTIEFTSQTAQAGNIHRERVNNMVIKNGTLRGSGLTTPYSINDTWIYDTLQTHCQFINLKLVNVPSHAYVGADHQLNTGTEKRGTYWHNILIEGQNVDPDNPFLGSVIRYKEGAEYNMHSDIRMYRGYSLVRSDGANDMWSNVLCEDMENEYIDPAVDPFPTAAIYYDDGGNTGKVQLDGLKWNHNNKVAMLVLKNPPATTFLRRSYFSNIHSLVNGVNNEFFHLIKLENAPYTSFEQMTLRPRIGGAAVHLINSPNVSFTNADINSIGTFLHAENSDSIRLDNFHLEARDGLFDETTFGSSAMYLSDGPTYANTGQANRDTLLAEGSLYQLESEDVSLVKRTGLAYSSLERPRLLIDRGSRVEGTQISGGRGVLEFSNADRPSYWKVDDLDFTLRFRGDDNAMSQRLFYMTSNNRLEVIATSAGELRITTVDGGGTTVSEALAADWRDGQYHTVRVKIAGTTLQTYFDGLLLHNLTTGLQLSQNTNTWYFGGRGSNATNGFDGAFDYIDIQGDVFEFDPATDPDINYTLGPGSTLLGYTIAPTRVAYEGMKTTQSGSKVIVEETGATAGTGGGEEYDHTPMLNRISQNELDIDALQAGSGGGGSTDTTALRRDINKNTAAIAGLGGGSGGSTGIQFGLGSVLSGRVVSSGGSAVQVTNADKPAAWRTNDFYFETRFRSNLTSNFAQYLFTASGTNGLEVRIAQDGSLKVTPRSASAVGQLETVDPGVNLLDLEFHVIRVSKSGSTWSVTVDGVTRRTFTYTENSIGSHTNDFYIGGRTVNATNGFDGAMDYAEINGVRLDFGGSPPIPYILDAGVSISGSGFTASTITWDTATLDVVPQGSTAYFSAKVGSGGGDNAALEGRVTQNENDIDALQAAGSSGDATIQFGEGSLLDASNPGLTGSGQAAVTFDNADIPAGWRTGDFELEFKFQSTVASASMTQYLFSVSGADGFDLIGRSVGGLRLTLRGGGGGDYTAESSVDWRDGAYHVFRLSKVGTNWKTYIDGALVHDVTDGGPQLQNNTNSIYVGGRTVNATNGFVGRMDYVDIQGTRFEFGGAPPVPYTLHPSVTVSGSQTNAKRVLAGTGISFEEVDSETVRLNVTATGSSTDDQTASEVPSTDGNVQSDIDALQAGQANRYTKGETDAAINTASEIVLSGYLTTTNSTGQFTPSANPDLGGVNDYQVLLTLEMATGAPNGNEVIYVTERTATQYTIGYHSFVQGTQYRINYTVIKTK